MNFGECSPKFLSGPFLLYTKLQIYKPITFWTYQVNEEHRTERNFIICTAENIKGQR